MLKIGLTGGIGVGKTTVSSIFLKLGIPVFYSDLEAKKCLEDNTELKNKLSDFFGTDLYHDGVLKRKKLSNIVFDSSENLNKINSLVHPYVQRSYERWCQIQSAPYLLKESAIIFESKTHHSLDSIICVVSNKKACIDRVVKRDNVSEKHVEKIMNYQLDQKAKTELSNYQIMNEDQLLIPQVLKLHDIFLNKSRILFNQTSVK